jgi:hypothetical protein
MSDPASERKSVREMSDEEILKTFDQLVEAWEGWDAAREQRETFDRDYRPPEDPAATIESTEALIEYNRQKWRYEQKREEVENRYAEHEANYNATSEVVRSLLPAGHTLLHTYRGYHPERQGAEYTIEHEGTGVVSPGVRDQSRPTRIIVRNVKMRPTP